jgi:hypothetical protein
MYRLISFCGVNLEYANQVEPVGSGPTPTAYMPLIGGGALDGFGNRQQAPGAVERVKSFCLRAKTPQDLQDLYSGLLALRGKRGALVRRMMNGDTHWQYARLAEVAAARDYQNMFPMAQDVDLRFALQESTWRGTLINRTLNAKWYLNDGAYFNAGLLLNGELNLDTPSAITLSLGQAEDAGRAPVRAIKIEITAGDEDLTALSIARTDGETLEWADVLPAGKSLAIDTGILQVTKDGVGAYDEMIFSPTADMATWFSLQPGDNEITIERTGGGDGAAISFQYYEAWY